MLTCSTIPYFDAPALNKSATALCTSLSASGVVTARTSRSAIEREAVALRSPGTSAALSGEFTELRAELFGHSLLTRADPYAAKRADVSSGAALRARCAHRASGAARLARRPQTSYRLRIKLRLTSLRGGCRAGGCFVA